MSMIEEIDRGTLNRFLVTPASRLAIMNAAVVEQAISTTVQTLIIVVLGARYPGGAARHRGPDRRVDPGRRLLGRPVQHDRRAGPLPRGDHRRLYVLHAPADVPVLRLHPAKLHAGSMQAIASRNPLNWEVQIGRDVLSATPDWSAVAVRSGGLLALALIAVAISVTTFRSYARNV
jgi:ABC-2 type transport system permease protein